MPILGSIYAAQRRWSRTGGAHRLRRPYRVGRGQNFPHYITQYIAVLRPPIAVLRALVSYLVGLLDPVLAVQAS
jgi:hypothetical protein